MRKYIRSFALGLAIGMVVCLLARKADADVLGPTFTGTKLAVTSHWAGSDTLYTDNDYTPITAVGEVLRVCNDKEDPRYYVMVIAEENAAWIRMTGNWAGDDHTDGSTYWYHNGYQFMVGNAAGTGYAYHINAAGDMVFPLNNDPVTPTISFGDGDTGFYEYSDDYLGVSLAGSIRFYFNGSDLQSQNFGGGARIRDVNGSATVPTHVFQSDTDTGLGRAAADVVSLIAGGNNLLNAIRTNINVPADSLLLVPHWNSIADDSLTVITRDANGDPVILMLDNAGASQFEARNSHVKYNLQAALIDTTGFLGGETWYSAIGDTVYHYLSDHTIDAAQTNLVVGTDVLAQQTIGIADNNLMEVDDASVADNDYVKATAAGFEGITLAELKTDLSLQPIEILDADDTLTANQSTLFSLYRPLTAKRTATLPTASAGLVFDFMVADTDSLLITAAAGDSLITSAGAAWKTTSSTGGTLRVVAVDAVRWIMFTSLGTWTSY